MNKSAVQRSISPLLPPDKRLKEYENLSGSALNNGATFAASHAFHQKPNESRLKSVNDRLSPIKTVGRETYPIKTNNFFDTKTIDEGEPDNHSPMNDIKNATFKEWNPKIKDIDHSSPWRRPSGKLVKEYWNKNEPSNPYNATWTRFILKTHFDIKLDQTDNQRNGSKWKVRRLKNTRLGETKERRGGSEGTSPQDLSKQMIQKLQEMPAGFRRPTSFHGYQPQSNSQQQDNYFLQPDINLVHKSQVINS